jgi:hypothetical protein
MCPDEERVIYIALWTEVCACRTQYSRVVGAFSLGLHRPTILFRIDSPVIVAFQCPCPSVPAELQKV